MKLLADAFAAQNPGVQADIARSLGTTGGIRALMAGAIDIATSARPVTAEEQAAGLVAQAFGRTPFVFVTSHRNPPADLTSRDIQDIYALKRRSWPDSSPIRVILRPKSDTDSEFLVAHFPGIEAVLDGVRARQILPVAKTDQDNLDEAESMAGSFTVSGLAALRSEQRKLHVLTLDGVTPDAVNVANGSYRYTKTLYLVTSPTMSPVARAFVEFIRSDPGRALLEQVATQPVTG